MTKTRYHSVETPIGFAEGKVVLVEKKGPRVLVVVRAWDESMIEVVFDEALGFREAMSHELSDLICSQSTGEFASWCTGRAYEGGHNEGESLFQFLDVDGEAAIEVVAKGVQIHVVRECKKN